MRAGDLRHTITIQRVTETTDDLGQPVQVWTDVATVRAAVEPLTGRELYAAQAVHAEAQCNVRIRYISGITTKDRVKYGSRYLNILSVIDQMERHRELVLLCSEVV